MRHWRGKVDVEWFVFLALAQKLDGCVGVAFTGTATLCATIIHHEVCVEGFDTGVKFVSALADVKRLVAGPAQNFRQRRSGIDIRRAAAGNPQPRFSRKHHGSTRQAHRAHH